MIRALAFVATLFLLQASIAHAETITMAALEKATHVHGIAIDRADPTRLLIATHHGLFRAGLILRRAQDVLGGSRDSLRRTLAKESTETPGT